ncbi:Ribosomal silencing factor RsfS [Caprobacter fermentans]|uniref:Ribosomal silencing factor RsfS n=1 Tax=Caproicibacter fermentans TaxID=2576756 RepID=A0A6N8I1Q8_9FIRM|nr:ribosome silencing factor [Caproicibacter fermentans]MVB11899.1 Ribosomal silencing factor RsfS [Caproicibacter fermentans]OCM99864.1 ribosome silencing factor [Clostridium sp. W14A]QNK41135.1 ribosome silencing factor [Caproicibacter fermentans]
MTSLELAVQAAKILDSKKAKNLKVIGIRDVSILADYFVLATGTSSTHVKSLADETEFQLGESGLNPGHKEGYRSNSWVLLDYGNVVVHVFTEESRNFYDLDRLWQDGEIVDLSKMIE